jgi:hypothetical protein
MTVGLSKLHGAEDGALFVSKKTRLHAFKDWMYKGRHLFPAAANIFRLPSRLIIVLLLPIYLVLLYLFFYDPSKTLILHALLLLFYFYGNLLIRSLGSLNITINMRSSVLFSFLATAGLAAAGPIPRNESSSTYNTKQWALTIPRPARFEIDTGVAKISLGVELGNAQDIPEWSSTKITSTNGSLSDIAASAISAMMGMRNSDGSFTEIGWWQAANAYTAAISYDKYTGSNTFSSQISQGMKSLIEEGPSDIFKTRGPGLRNEYNDDSLWWALACIDAAETYGDATFSAQAKALWQWIHDASLITETGIAPSMGGVSRTVVLSDQCSLEGGVYWTSLANEDYVNSITTALMMQMSARLGMGDSAQVTADWLRRHTVDGDQMVTSDGVRGDSCTTESGAFTYNTGMYQNEVLNEED